MKILVINICLVFVPLVVLAQNINYSALGLANDKISSQLHKVPTDIDFSYDCFLSNPFALGAFMTHKSEVEAVNMLSAQVSDEEENDYGDKAYEEMQNKYTFIQNDARLEALQQMTGELVKCRPSDRRNLKYTVHLIEDKTINAFTVGGHIFVFTGIIDYCATASELATILAHEIGHNEKYHINRMMRRIKMAGDFANIIVSLKKITTASFNQFNEIEVDCYGADLTYAAGYDPVNGANLWKRLSADNNEQSNMLSKLMALFSTHPYSYERYECMTDHIEKNYNLK